MGLLMMIQQLKRTLNQIMEQKRITNVRKLFVLVEFETFFYNLGSLSGTFDITSNYIFRGVSNSNNNPAYQGGLTYTFSKFGFYIFTWGSNVDFPAGTHETATLELDLGIGIANKINDYFNYDASFVQYFYPKAPSAQYNEFINKFFINYSIATVILEASYSYNAFNSGKSGKYYNVELDIRIPAKYFFTLDNVTAYGWVGHYSLPGRSFGLGSYNDYMAGLKKSIWNLHHCFAMGRNERWIPWGDIG